MPHIHTEPGEHDITVSAWIFKECENDDPQVLVHMHRRVQKLVQIGGHVEKNETPWQTLAHEIPEESGYSLDELQIMQPFPVAPSITAAVVHPLPANSNTHMVCSTHYHSDYGYAFIAKDVPQNMPGEGESSDLRWMTIKELYVQAEKGIALRDVPEIYESLASRVLPSWYRIDATSYSVDKPSKSLLE